MKIKSAVAFVLLLVPLGIVTGFAQEPMPVTKNYIVWAHEFLRTMYPELSDKKYILTLETAGGYDYPGVPLQPLMVYVGMGPEYQTGRIIAGYDTGPPGKPKPPPEGFQFGPEHPKQVLTATFRFDDYDHLVNFSANGTTVHDPEKNRAIDEQVYSHPEMTDAEVAAALKKAGVKYGPEDKEQFIRDLPIDRLERFLGKLRIVSVGFLPLDENRNNASGWPLWTVTAEAKRQDGTVATYELRFERFKGDLTGIMIHGLAIYE